MFPICDRDYVTERYRSSPHCLASGMCASDHVKYDFMRSNEHPTRPSAASELGERQRWPPVYYTLDIRRGLAMRQSFLVADNSSPTHCPLLGQGWATPPSGLQPAPTPSPIRILRRRPCCPFPLALLSTRPIISRFASEFRTCAREPPADRASLNSLSPASASCRNAAKIDARRSPRKSASNGVIKIRTCLLTDRYP